MKPSKSTPFRLTLTAAAQILLLTSTIYAADSNGTWNVDADGNWNDDINWAGSIIADGIDFTAFFTHEFTANRTVTLGADRTIGNITFTDGASSSHDLTLTGNILTLDVTAGAPVIDVTQTDRTLGIASIITGTDGLSKNGTGKLLLTGINTYTGATTLNGGILRLGTGGQLGTGAYAGAISIASGTSFQYGSNLAQTLTGAITGAGDAVLENSNPLVISGNTLTLGSGTGTGWSGTTTIGTGMTLRLEGSGATSNALRSSTGITLNGGNLAQFNDNNVSPINQRITDRISNTSPISSSGGSITLTIGTTNSSASVTETLGPVALAAGQTNLVLGSTRTASSTTLFFSGLTRTGPGNTSNVTFSGATTGLSATVFNRIQVIGAGTTLPGQIVGAWATVGTTPANQTDYAAYNGGFAVGAAIAASTEDTWTDPANSYTLSGGASLSGTRTMTALRAVDAAQTLELGDFNLQSGGLLNGGTGLLTVAASGSGALTTATGGGLLYLTMAANNISIAAPITNNGGDVGVVVAGSTARTLSLFGANDYSGGTTINAGKIAVGNNNALGTGDLLITAAAGNQVLLAGGLDIANKLTIRGGGISGQGIVFVSGSNASATYGGDIDIQGPTFAGGHFGANATGSVLTLTGKITSSVPVAARIGTVVLTNTASSYDTLLNYQGITRLGATNAIPVGATLTLGLSGASTLDLAGNNQTLAGVIKSTNGATISNSVAASTSTLTTTGTSTFAGAIANGAGTTALTVDGGSLTLTGANTYSGNTTVNSGTLGLATVNGSNETSTVTIGATGVLALTFTGTDTVGALFIGAARQPAGVYGHTASGADNGGQGVGIFDARFAAGTGTLTVVPQTGYSSWAALNGAGPDPTLDHDSDGVPNGVEYFIGGPTGNTTGFTALPSVIKAGGALSITYTHDDDYEGAYGTDFVVETSDTLANPWTTAPLGVNVTHTGNVVTYTFPAPLGAKKFVRLKVTGP